MAGYENQKTLTTADKKYCHPCVYKGVFAEDYLCNYIGITGKPRGCSAGVGCTQRRTEPLVVSKLQLKSSKSELPKGKKKIQCAMCGNIFIGSSKARYCEHCRKIRLQQGRQTWLNSKQEKAIDD